jgi:hypothetical protein
MINWYACQKEDRRDRDMVTEWYGARSIECNATFDRNAIDNELEWRNIIAMTSLSSQSWKQKCMNKIVMLTSGCRGIARCRGLKSEPKQIMFQRHWNKCIDWILFRLAVNWNVMTYDGAESPAIELKLMLSDMDCNWVMVVRARMARTI